MSTPATSEFHITSLVVHAAAAQLQQLSHSINQLAGTEVHAATADGKLVVTIEGESQKQLLDQVEAINGMAGVLSSSLIYHQVDQASH
ncbi:chaperone NapD [Shewanella avicenniae]|uniref:Chaperone NapD n=1 Tax=Shewanella avicenniae TaxID=2814294 RepID=A0ABX7QS39_9GAMM|nr:chaperone NapD [Shewanella avicenniae]QSX34276.1 chaperone NapD [Shewanella avicenniae]